MVAGCRRRTPPTRSSLSNVEPGERNQVQLGGLMRAALPALHDCATMPRMGGEVRIQTGGHHG